MPQAGYNYDDIVTWYTRDVSALKVLSSERKAVGRKLSATPLWHQGNGLMTSDENMVIVGEVAAKRVAKSTAKEAKSQTYHDGVSQRAWASVNKMIRWGDADGAAVELPTSADVNRVLSLRRRQTGCRKQSPIWLTLTRQHIVIPAAAPGKPKVTAISHLRTYTLPLARSCITTRDLLMKAASASAAASLSAAASDAGEVADAGEEEEEDDPHYVCPCVDVGRRSKKLPCKEHLSPLRDYEGKRECDVCNKDWEKPALLFHCILHDYDCCKMCASKATGPIARAAAAVHD